jgi:glycosyltransferase involved in cell wall biosynthesis
MNGDVKISVLTISLNSEQTLEKTIQSVLNQTFKNVEYIVVDGGSQQPTLDILTKYKDKIDQLVCERDNGISDAFNKGIALCSGEIIGILNSDDWYEPHALEQINNSYRRFPDTDVFYGELQNWKNGQTDMYLSSNSNLAHLKREMVLAHPACFVKKSAYEKWGYYSNQYEYAMDYELMLRFHLLGAKFVAVPHTLSNMRLEGKSSKRWYRAHLEVYRAQKEWIGNPMMARVLFMFRILKASIRILLTAVGLESIVHSYRKSQKWKHHSKL